MKIRITIEYDPDWPEGANQVEALEQERQDWLKGHVDIADIHYAGDNKVEFEVVA
jgi:pentose-5-phosphate-3-epimerase